MFPTKLAAIVALSALMSGGNVFMIEQADSSGHGQGLCIQPPAGLSAGAGSDLVLRQCSNADNSQLWSWSGIAGTAPGQLVWEGNPTLCMDAGSSPTTGTNPLLEPCNGVTSQLWSNVAGGLEWQTSPNLCLDSAIEVTNGRIVLVTCGAGINEDWTRD